MINDNKLTINTLIKLLNKEENLCIERKKYIIDTYPSIKFNYELDIDIIIYILIIGYNNIKYSIDNTTYKILIDYKLVKETKDKIIEIIKYISVEFSIKKKIISILLHNEKINQNILNETFLIFSVYFNINIIVYNVNSQISKCYYYDNYLDIDLPFIILKENSYYELVYIDNKTTFDYNHQIIKDLIEEIYIIGFEKNKKLKYLNKMNIEYHIQKLPNKPFIRLPILSNKIYNFIKENRNITKHEIFLKKIKR